MKSKYIIILFLILFLNSNSSAQSIYSAYDNSFIICQDGTVKSWGYNNVGQLGINTSFQSLVPVQVFNSTGFKSISAGQGNSLALKNDSTVWAWGNNSNGEQGNGPSAVPSKVPVMINSLSKIISVSYGAHHCLALKSDGTVWAWGAGELGIGTTSSNIPLQVSVLTNVIAISAGNNHSLALKNDGTVWAWGYNNKGQLGIGTTSLSSVPVQVSSMSNIVNVVACSQYYNGFSLALKNDGTVWAWGDNTYGQLGDGTNVNKLIPVQVNGLNNVNKIVMGSHFCFALKNDGTVWAWGSGGDHFGNGVNTSDSNIPLQINTLTGFVSISAGFQHAMGLKQDGTIWTWGSNSYGQQYLILTGTSDAGAHPTPHLLSGVCSQATGLIENERMSLLNIYPNPANNHIIIDNISNITGCQIRISNSIGQQVFFDTITGQQFKLDITTMGGKGLYYLNIIDAQGITIETKKIILE